MGVITWMAGQGSWISEGGCADILEPIVPLCAELLFLNPGLEACIAHCRARAWAAEKFRIRQMQDGMLDDLIEWARSCEQRSGDNGLARLRALHDAFPGGKREFRDPSAQAAF